SDARRAVGIRNVFAFIVAFQCDRNRQVKSRTSANATVLPVATVGLAASIRADASFWPQTRHPDRTPDSKPAWAPSLVRLRDQGATPCCRGSRLPPDTKEGFDETLTFAARFPAN